VACVCEKTCGVCVQENVWRVCVRKRVACVCKKTCGVYVHKKVWRVCVRKRVACVCEREAKTNMDCD